MISKIKALFASALLLLSATASAASPASIIPAVQMRSTVTMYTVSGLLRSKDGSTLKIVQGLAYGASRDEATLAFSANVLSKYPEHSLLDTVATALPAISNVCGKSI